MPTKTPTMRALCACKQPTCLWCFYGLKYQPRALRSRQPSTRRLYGVTLRVFGRFVERKPRLSDLNDETVGDFVVWRLDGGASAATVNRDLINLLAIWRWAHKKHHLKNWPDVELERVPKRTPRAFTMDELSQLLGAAQKETRPVGGVSGADWWTALLLVCFDTGERIGAVRRLTWDQVDLSRGFVTFLAEHRKGAREDSTKDIDPSTIAAIKRLPRVAPEVFPWPYCETYLWTKLKPLLVRAGLPTTRIFKFHCVRRSTASHIEAAGGNATEFFGHSKRSVTLAYIDPRIAKQRSQLHLLPRPTLPK